MSEFRVESDSLGEMKVPAKALYGASTQRAVENFKISGLTFSREFIEALTRVKIACTEVNLELKKLDAKKAKAILKACEEILSGKHDAQFIVDIYQTGSGTSTNMNFNEVAANIANLSLGSKLGSKKPVHPNDDVNLGQSSNDVFPTVMHVSAVIAVHSSLIPALKKLEATLEKKAVAFEKIIKTGRTHLQDAAPLTLGQEFSGYSAQVKNARIRIEKSLEGMYELAIGGTAVGTGINTDPQFGKLVAKKLATVCKLPFKEAANHFEAQASKDACVELSGSLKTLSVSLTKIANDLRWLSCGPRTGIGEIFLPVVQPGSSIMPGKTNPVIAESLLQVCAVVIGNDATITWAGANGNFELNVMMPVLIHNLLGSIQLLSRGVSNFEEKCVRGITANEKQIKIHLENNLMLATALVPLVGYDKATKLAQKALIEGKTVREIAGEYGKALDPKVMVFGSVGGKKTPKK